MSLQQKKGLSCKGSDRPYREREIHLTKIVLFASKVSLQQFVPSLTDGYSLSLARYNNVCNICIHLNLSILITFTQATHSAETNLISTTDEQELVRNMLGQPMESLRTLHDLIQGHQAALTLHPSTWPWPAPNNLLSMRTVTASLANC